MNLALLAHGEVGEKITLFLCENYLQDIGIIVTMGESKIQEIASSFGVKSTIWNKFKQDNTSYDLGVLAWWPKILKDKEILKSRHGFINFHPSYLPFNKGKNYNFWALVEECPFGVTLHFINSGIDTGDILSQKKIPYDWTDNGKTLFDKAQKEIVSLFKSNYDSFRKLEFNRTPQDLTQGTFHYSHEIEEASTINLDKKYTGRELINLLRARTFPGHPGCKFKDKGMVYEARITITEKVN